MKNRIIKCLHFVFGYQNYLRFFTRFKIRFLKYDRRKKDFLFFEKSLADQANIIVIGANTGITTIPFAKGKGGRKVLAYEPLPSNFNVLNDYITHYSITNVQCYMIALGNKVGQEEMVLPILNGTKKHGMAYIDSSSIDTFEKGEKFTIQMDKLDDRVELQKLRIDAIKLVAENYETEILKGAKDLILKQKPFIYCELWHNENRMLTLNLIKEYGYQVYFREGEELKIYTGSNYSGKNFFFKAV